MAEKVMAMLKERFGEDYEIQNPKYKDPRLRIYFRNWDVQPPKSIIENSVLVRVSNR